LETTNGLEQFAEAEELSAAAGVVQLAVIVTPQTPAADNPGGTVGTVTVSPVFLQENGSTTAGVTAFHAVGKGSAVITAQAPPGYDQPGTGGSYNPFVVATVTQ
jgi:hypothetical protein